MRRWQSFAPNRRFPFDVFASIPKNLPHEIPLPPSVAGSPAPWHARDMTNEGGRPFLFPARFPNMEMFSPTWTASIRIISMKCLKTSALLEGSRYPDLVPDANLVSPSETHLPKGFTGWAYCAGTPDKTFFLAYFEKDCPNHGTIRGAMPNTLYQAQWFDPRTGQWSPAGAGRLQANV